MSDRTDNSDYLAWLADGGWIRVSAHAIIFNRSRDRILIESNFGLQAQFVNFIGGGVAVGESLLACLERELREELDVKIRSAKYLFVLENFFPHQTEMRHSLEHYFEIELDGSEFAPSNPGVAYDWIPIADLPAVDLRPSAVRDSIVDNTYSDPNYMILRNVGR